MCRVKKVKKFANERKSGKLDKKVSHTSTSRFVCMLAMENYQSLRHHHLRCVVEQLALLVIFRSLKPNESDSRNKRKKNICEI